MVSLKVRDRYGFSVLIDREDDCLGHKVAIGGSRLFQFIGLADHKPGNCVCARPGCPVLDTLSLGVSIHLIDFKERAFKLGAIRDRLLADRYGSQRVKHDNTFLCLSIDRYAAAVRVHRKGDGLCHAISVGRNRLY